MGRLPIPSVRYTCTHIAANISKFWLVMKPTETNCPLVFEAVLHDSTLNTRWMLNIFSLPIARLHSGGRHDETVCSSLVPVYYPLLHHTNWYPDKQGIDTIANWTSIDTVSRTFRTCIYYSTLACTKILGMGTWFWLSITIVIRDWYPNAHNNGTLYKGFIFWHGRKTFRKFRTWFK